MRNLCCLNFASLQTAAESLQALIHSRDPMDPGWGLLIELPGDE